MGGPEPAPLRRRRVLVVAPRMPGPLHSGERWILSLIKRLSADHDVSLLAFQETGDPAAVAYGLWLERSFLRRLEALPPPPPGGEGAPDELPDAVRPFYSAAFLETLSRVVREDPPDVVHVHFFEMAHCIEALPPGLPAVLTEHDASHFWASGSYLREGGGAGAGAERERRLSHARKHYPRYAARTALSCADARQLEALLGAGPFEVVPLTADVEGLSAPLPEAGAAPACDLLFVGNYRHYPNEDAALTLTREILPALRRARPGVTLRLAGAHPTPAVAALAGAGVEVTGTLPSLAPVLKSARVFVAPLRLGSGVKGKILEALAAGLPVVASPEAAAGFDEPAAREAMLVGEVPGGFCAAVERLLDDPALRAELGRRGAAAARERYDDSRAAEAFALLYSRLRGESRARDARDPRERAVAVVAALEAAIARGRAAGGGPEDDRIREFYLEATHRCDLECFMCEHWSVESRDPDSVRREMSVSELEEALSASRLLDPVEQAVVTGGEAWLRADSARLVAAVARRFPSARLIALSNLWNTGLLRRRLAELAELGVTRLHLGSSLDGLDRDHDDVRGRAGAFAGTLRTVEMLRRDHPEIGFGFTYTITPRNYGGLLAAYRFVAESLGCDFGAQFVVQTEGIERVVWPEGALESVDRQIEEILERLVSKPATRREADSLLAGNGRPGVAAWREVVYWSRLRRARAAREDLMTDCLSGRRYAMLDPEGRVFFCPVGRRHVIGSVRERPFDEIWRGEEARRERERISVCQCREWIRCIANPIVDRHLRAAGR